MPDDRVLIDARAREQRLYDRLRALVVRRAPGARSGAADLLLLLPDLTVLLARLARDPRVPAGGKALALLAVAYVLSPLDLIPDLLLGPVALLDDLLVLAAALSRVLNYVHPDVVRSHWSGQGDALDAVERVTQWSEDLLARRIPRALQGLLGLRRGLRSPRP